MTTNISRIFLILSIFFTYSPLGAQSRYELSGNWKCAPIAKVPQAGLEISQPAFDLSGFMTATVPGTVLTTLLNNDLVPDPFYGMNNEQIPDIYETGRDHYTYWFVKDFEETAAHDEQVWLHFRGVNYSCEVFLNGQKVNETRHEGMFLRQSYNITGFLSPTGKNRLAVIVYPPDPVGDPNGGQGGDGTIARNVAHQYVAGWDWIQPVRDRNTGIWDKVFIETTGPVNIKNPHVITQVPGVRDPYDKSQAPALLKVSAELENATSKDVTGILKYVIQEKEVSKKVTIRANSTEKVALPDHLIQNPKLWWPNMYGPQNLYAIELSFTERKKEVSDREKVSFGVRKIQKQWNPETRSMQIHVNGRKIFIKGGNWIISDAMLRFSDERYDAEVRHHRDMNLNLIRIWGGALTERPEFYAACDKYGLLVIQDFWMSGDCNGKWLDPMKKEDQWTRRKYPDDHDLFLESARDQIKMIRNHPSLAMYCGGNEITPPEDILLALKNEIIPELDGTRWFIEYSNSDSMSFNSIGGNGDGPYTIQPIEVFWEHQTWPFNSEVGSVGVGDLESLRRFIPEAHLVPPAFNDTVVDPVWTYHKYIGYEDHIRPYGDATDAGDFARKAQLVNYNQYRALMEGFSAHMWEWYTGTIIWKTQNPWTALRGQMYDYYLDPNACLYGLRKGGEPLHVMYNPADGMIMAVNNSFEPCRSMMLRVETIDMEGNSKLYTQVFVGIEPISTKKYFSVKPLLEKVAAERGAFLRLQLLSTDQQTLAENFYWIPDSEGNYSGLHEMEKASLQIAVRAVAPGQVEVTLKNPENNPVAFFNRISLVDPSSGERILPTFYEDNYVSVASGEEKMVLLMFSPEDAPEEVSVAVEGWNVTRLETVVGR